MHRHLPWGVGGVPRFQMATDLWGNLLSIHIVAHMVGQSFGVETSRVPPSMLCSFSMSRVSFHVNTLM